MWELLERRRWILPSALVLAVTLAYLPSLAGGFLNYDDPWLIEHNAAYRDASLGTLRSFFFDWSLPTRMKLGAEWLPLRDVSLWIDFRLVGASPQALRLTQLGSYLLACLAFRGALRRSIQSARVAEAAAWVFALHPVHAESVAWLAGRKDVLALVFVGAALYTYASPSRRIVWITPILLGFAHLSKSMTVSAVGLLVAQDLIARRRPRWALIGLSLGVAVAAFGAHAYVGRTVGMTALPHGGDRFATLLIMGAVWVRYLALLAVPAGLSVVHDVPSPGVAEGLLGWLVVLAWGGMALLWWRRRREGWPLSAWIWLVIPLAPVSQVVFPLQNVMADRYLFLSAMTPALFLACALCEKRSSLAMLVALGLGGVTQSRAHLFANSAALFRDASSFYYFSALSSLEFSESRFSCWKSTTFK